MATVKTLNPSRAERARQTRDRMIDSAKELFVAQGYAATAMEQIAAAAGVAVQTVYYTFKTKGQLLAEVVEVTAAGDDDSVPPSRRAWVQEMLAASSPQRVTRSGGGKRHGDLHARSRRAVARRRRGAAAADPYVDEYWRGVVGQPSGRSARDGGQGRRAGGPSPRAGCRAATDLSSCSSDPTSTADSCRRPAGPSLRTRPGCSPPWSSSCWTLARSTPRPPPTCPSPDSCGR